MRFIDFETDRANRLELILNMILQGHAVAAGRGGFVVGYSQEDTIPMLMPSYHPDGTLAGIDLVGYCHEGEFLVCSAATHRHRQRLEQMNDEGNAERAAVPDDDEQVDFSVSLVPSVHVLNTHRGAADAPLLIDPAGQFVMNRRAMMLHADEVIALNYEGLASSGSRLST